MNVSAPCVFRPGKEHTVAAGFARRYRLASLVVSTIRRISPQARQDARTEKLLFRIMHLSHLWMDFTSQHPFWKSGFPYAVEEYEAASIPLIDWSTFYFIQKRLLNRQRITNMADFDAKNRLIGPEVSTFTLEDTADGVPELTVFNQEKKGYKGLLSTPSGFNAKEWNDKRLILRAIIGGSVYLDVMSLDNSYAIQALVKYPWANLKQMHEASPLINLTKQIDFASALKTDQESDITTVYRGRFVFAYTPSAIMREQLAPDPNQPYDSRQVNDCFRLEGKHVIKDVIPLSLGDAVVNGSAGQQPFYGLWPSTSEKPWIVENSHALAAHRLPNDAFVVALTPVASEKDAPLFHLVTSERCTIPYATSQEVRKILGALRYGTDLHNEQSVFFLNEYLLACCTSQCVVVLNIATNKVSVLFEPRKTVSAVGCAEKGYLAVAIETDLFLYGCRDLEKIATADITDSQLQEFGKLLNGKNMSRPDPITRQNGVLMWKAKDSSYKRVITLGRVRALRDGVTLRSLELQRIKQEKAKSLTSNG